MVEQAARSKTSRLKKGCPNWLEKNICFNVYTVEVAYLLIDICLL